ncbi:MAG: hypothetical protein ABL977_03190 [Candidatus Eisenbacteria bacterium]
MPVRQSTKSTPSRSSDRASHGGSAAAWGAAERLAVLVAFAAVLVSVSFELYEYDFWQHLTFGKALWQLQRVPTQQVWTWLDHGAPVQNPSWGFSAVLWPFWSLGGVTGLAVWRWLSTLVVFALLWRTARALGVRSVPPLVTLVLCALVYRQRSQVRPETLAAMLLAFQLWLLATRRGPGWRDIALVATAWGWANVHLSWYLGLAVLALHAFAPIFGRDPAARTRALGLVPVLLGALAVSFVNPFGWRTVWRPFEFALHWRHDPLLSGISELRALDWRVNLSNGLPVLMAGWPLLILWRSRRAGLDPIELGTAVLATALALTGTRFVATYALLAAPWLARDLDAWWRERRGAPLHGWRVALTTSALCVLLPLHEWTHFENRLGVGIDRSRYPEAACDFMVAHDVRGRGLNDFYLGGYLLWRFWPDPSRLPYFDIHPEDKPPAERLAYLRAFTSLQGWRELDARLRFDYALVSRSHVREGYGLLDQLDADPAWALVFVDDVAALYVRRDGPMAALAAEQGYRALAGGRLGLERIAAAAARSPAAAESLGRELGRQAAQSAWVGSMQPLRELAALGSGAANTAAAPAGGGR